MGLHFRLRHLATALLAVAAALPLAGCIRSRVAITSEPSGAEVIWRGRPYGATPVTIPFIWYWHHDFVLEKPGYEPKEVVERFRTPPWFLMPTDLIMEIIPFPFPDERKRHYVLTPKSAEFSDLDVATTAGLPVVPMEPLPTGATPPPAPMVIELPPPPAPGQ